jgi:Protein of unknown function (DUF2950)
MRHVKVQKFNTSQTLWLKATVVVGVAVLAITLVRLSVAQKTAQESFPSVEAATHALFIAVQKDNDQALVKILGGGTDLISTDDRARDKLEREQFAKKYEEMHRLVREPDGTTVLYVGAENWPFPVPLVSKAGAWYFDAVAGKEEVLFRRIGENEATTIEICHALVQSRQQPETTTTDDDAIIRYAQTFIGTHETDAGRTAAAGKQEPSGPFHGYYFRMLSGQPTNGRGGAGFAFIAYPVEYRSSGVMTFFVTQDNLVYEKDLGPDTAKLAKKMTAGLASSSWHAAE